VEFFLHTIEEHYTNVDMKLLTHFCFLLLFLSSFSLFAQEDEISSVQVWVIDEDQTPIEKVRILIDGNRLVSDAHGAASCNLTGEVKDIEYIDAFKKHFKLKDWNYDNFSKRIIVNMESENDFIKGELLIEHNIPFEGGKIRLKNALSFNTVRSNELGFFRIAVPAGFSIYDILDKPELIVNDYEIPLKNMYVDKGRKFITIRTIKADISKKNGKTVLILDQNQKSIPNLNVRIEGQSNITDKNGKIKINTTSIDDKDVFIQGYTIDNIKFAKNTISLLVHKKGKDESLLEEVIEENNDSSKNEKNRENQINTVKYQISDTSSFTQDFEYVINQLEVKKQLLIEKNLVLRREINKIAAKLEKKGEALSEMEKANLEENLFKLNDALINNEITYQKTQAQTHEVIDHIQKDLLKIQEEKKFVEFEFHIFIAIALVLLAFIIIVWIVARRVYKQNVELERTKKELEQRINQINAQKEQMQELNTVISSKNKKIIDSIRYAKTIQEAILPAPLQMAEAFNDYFILYKPKDIVSGDFYWFYHDKNRTFIAAVDCTGHGVSGGFMSMIGNALLNEIISKQKIVEPAKILEKLNQQIKIALKQDEKGNDDGMDICLCLIEQQDERSSKLTFSGAKRPLYYIRQENNNIETLKGDVKSVGGKQYKHRSFTEQELVLNKGDMIYLTSDGLADQNDVNKRKFGSTRLKEMLNQNAYLSMDEQKNLLDKALEKHQEGTEQRDDITLIGATI
jgi:serine phosphatase RsbU (regulator of sigma subunit)